MTRSLGTGDSHEQRAGPAVYVSRAADALDGRAVLRLPPAHRSRLLVSLAVLDRHGSGRGHDLPYAAPVGRGGLHAGAVLDVPRLGFADAQHPSRPGVVALAAALHPQRGRPGPARGKVQRRPEAPLLGLLLVRDRALPHRSDPLAPPLDPVEPGLPAAD